MNVMWNILLNTAWIHELGQKKSSDVNSFFEFNWTFVEGFTEFPPGSQQINLHYEKLICMVQDNAKMVVKS